MMDERRNDFGTKLIYPFFPKKTSSIKHEKILSSCLKPQEIELVASPSGPLPTYYAPWANNGTFTAGVHIGLYKIKGMMHLRSNNNSVILFGILGSYLFLKIWRKIS